MESQMLLRDPDIFPTETVLRKELGDNVFKVLDTLFTTVLSLEFGLSIEWRYYNDGRAWLCKVTHKKKTIFWLSIWENIFKVSFYFTEKYVETIKELDIEKTIINTFAETKPIGRLIPMIFNIDNQEQLKDLFTVIRFKKSGTIN